MCVAVTWEDHMSFYFKQDLCVFPMKFAIFCSIWNGYILFSIVSKKILKIQKIFINKM